MASLSRVLRVAASRPRSPAHCLGLRPLSNVAGAGAEKNVPYQRTLKGEDEATHGPSRPLPSTADVVVIGGGSLGCQTLYHLAKLGVSGAVLLERDRLTSGTTWHTAGRGTAVLGIMGMPGAGCHGVWGYGWMRRMGSNDQGVEGAGNTGHGGCRYMEESVTRDSDAEWGTQGVMSMDAI